MKFDIYTQDGKKTGTTEGSDLIFSLEANPVLISQALHRQQGNARQGTAHTKTRGEIAYSTKKIYRQKGTGSARHGAKSANLFRKGGVTFGPRYGVNWTTDMPKKQRRKALFCALSARAKENAIFCLDKYDGQVKTKPFAQMLKNLPPMADKKNVLIVLSEKNHTIEKSSKNLPNTKTITSSYLNIADCLKYDSLMFVGDALKKTEETFLQKNS